MSARILVCDDNLELAENVAEILGQAGLEVDVFGAPQAALAAIAPGRYAAAILDLRMPHMDGVELFRELKRQDPTLPAIAMTAYAEDERVRAAIAEGMLAILPKPLDIPRLLSRLREVTGGERALVVEDDAALAQDLVEILGSRGFAAQAVASCAEARRQASTNPPQVLLVDVRLPDGDGIELVDELLRSGLECTNVVFSGYARELVDPRGRAAKSGATFFEKPLDVEQLLAALERRSGAVRP